MLIFHCNTGYFKVCYGTVLTYIAIVLQISDEAKKFAYQTGIRVVVCYGGAPVHNQVCILCSFVIAIRNGA